MRMIILTNITRSHTVHGGMDLGSTTDMQIYMSHSTEGNMQKC